MIFNNIQYIKLMKLLLWQTQNKYNSWIMFMVLGRNVSQKLKDINSKGSLQIKGLSYLSASWLISNFTSQEPQNNSINLLHGLLI